MATESGTQRRFGLMQMAYWGLVGTFTSYIVTLLTVRGYSSAQIGLLTAGTTAGFLIGQTVLGAVADATRKNRRLYILCCVCSFAACMALYFANALWQVAVSMFVLGLFRDPGSCILDSWVIKHYAGEPERFGAIRSRGSVFYAVFMLGYGFVLDALGMDVLPVTNAVFAVLCVVSALSVPELEGAPRERSAGRSGFSSLKGVMSPLMLAAMLLFFLLGLCAQSMLSFMPVVLDGLGGTVSMLGIMYFASAFSEYFFMRGLPFMRAFHVYGRLLISTGLYVLATVLAAFASQPWMLVGTMAVSGAAYGLQLPARREVVARMVPERFQTSVHGVMDMLYSGFGLMMGTAMVGALIDGAGSRAALLLCAGLQLVAACVALAAGAMSRRQIGTGAISGK